MTRSGAIRSWADHDQADLILTTGGTGLTPRDITPEATRTVLEKEASGIAEALRMSVYPRFHRAALSRGTAGVRGADVKSRPVGFRMVPRLNAAGRVARGKLAVDLLLAPDAASAARLASELETQNVRRRALQERVEVEARDMAAAVWQQGPRAALALVSDTWHPGVVGIAAARLAEEYRVPVALVAVQHGVGKGSVRTGGV